MTALALASMATPAFSGVAGPSDPMLIVRAYDNYGVTAGELEAAKTDVRRIFTRADIAIRWIDCLDPATGACALPPGHNELILRFMRGSATVEGGPFTMGDALVKDHAMANGLLTIYPDRVARLANHAARLRLHTSDSDPLEAALLGRVIAHEIGHLLLGPAHSPHGLMRPAWTGRDVIRDSRYDWVFASGEARRMREILAVSTSWSGRSRAPHRSR